VTAIGSNTFHDVTQPTTFCPFLFLIPLSPLTTYCLRSPMAPWSPLSTLVMTGDPLWADALASPDREYWIAGAREEIQSLKDLQAYVLSLFPLADPWLYKLELCTTHRARYQCGHHALLSSRLCYRDCPRRIHHL
jgi:hypothetical protein